MAANWKVALAALVVWGLSVFTTVKLDLLDTNLLFLSSFLGLVLVPVVVAANDTLLTYRRRASPRPAQDRHDRSESNLRAVLGEENVAPAWNVRIEAVPTLIDAPSKFGGRPTYGGPERWPRCAMCSEPMTFIGQLEVGPGRPLRYPTEGALYMFLCNSDPLTAPQCETSTAVKGGSACFVQPGATGALPLGEGPTEHDLLAKAVARNRDNTSGGARLFEGLERRGKRTYTPYLARQYAVLEIREQPSVRIDRVPEKDLALASAAMGAFSIQLGGFADWVQEPVELRCRCGAPTELLVQFDAFDEVINLGDAGRAYVFACQARCGPDSFFLEWQCS
jgi:hypothetical protein